MSDPNLSVVIAVWNEDPRNLRELHARLQGVLASLGMAWELLFVDDASGTHTRQTLTGLAARDPRVRLLFLARRSGQEAAVVAGLLQAKGEFICTLDCDLQNRPEDIPKVLAPLLDGYDLVLGTRRPSQGYASGRRAVSWVYTRLMRVRWQAGISDWGCGFNAGQRAVFEILRDRLHRGNPGPLKVTMMRHARRWTEVDVTHDPRRYGRSGYTGAHFLWHAVRMLVIGNTVIPGRVSRAPIAHPREHVRREPEAAAR